MFNRKWIIGAVVFNGIVIIVLTVYLILNFSNFTPIKGIVLLIVLGIVMLSIIGILAYLYYILTTRKNTDKNLPPDSDKMDEHDAGQD